MSSKQIVVRFEPESNAEFVGEDCVGKYESALLKEFKSLYPEADIELSDDSPMGTKVDSYGFEHLEESEIEDVIFEAMNRVGNDLTNICA